MAWFYGTYSCGHDGRVNIIGPTKDRQWKADRKFEGLCPECYEKKKAEEQEKENQEAAAKSAEMELPELSGTEKQVAWATTIRMSFMEKFQKLTDRLKNLPEEEAKFKIKNSNGDRIDISGAELIEAMDYCISSKTEARFWIDNRNSGDAILADVYMEYKRSGEVPEDIKAELRAEEESLTVRPETVQKDGVVKLYEMENSLRVEYAKDNDFNSIVKRMGYRWGGRTWGKEINEYSGELDDRAAEIGNTLLSHGFTVRFMNEKQKKAALAGTFPAECSRWVKYYAKGEKLALCWSEKNDRLYNYAKKISSARWSSELKAVHVPIEYYKQVEDFAEAMGFRFSKAATAAIQNYMDEESRFVINAVTEAKPTETSCGESLKKRLEANGAIIEDLMDEA